MEKLINIQNELKAPKMQFNKFGNYNYRNCEDILEALKPLLKKHELTLIITDEVVMIGNRFYVKATATISDNKANNISVSAFARESEEKKGMDASQITGAASSYARKYALNGLFLIDDNKDNDYQEKPLDVNNTTDIINVIKQMNESKTLDDVKKVWTDNKQFQTSEAFIKAKDNKKKELGNV